MTQEQQLQKLKIIVQAQYKKAQYGFQEIVALENMVRKELVRLTDMETTARQSSNSDLQIKAIGADVVWNAWLGRARSNLNMKLARILARKEPHLKTVKQAYGRLLVIEQLIETERRNTRKRGNTLALDAAILRAAIYGR